MYHDVYQVYELLDMWNHSGPPDPDAVQDLFVRQPKVAMQQFLYGQTLLHKCVENYSDRLDLITIFLNAYPKSAMREDDNGFLPIHRALISARTSATIEVIRFLIEQEPETILYPTSSGGSLPLHLACQSGCHISIVKYLMESFPDAIRYRDRQGLFPLDYALEDNGVASKTCDMKDDNVVELLVQSYPVVLSFLDDEGRLPIHRILAKRRYRYNRIVDILVEYCPGTLRYQDQKYGQTPLLQACRQNNSLSQVYSIVRKWPEQVTTQSELIFGKKITGTDDDADDDDDVDIDDDDYCPTFNGEMLPSALIVSSATFERVRQWVKLRSQVCHEKDLQGRLPIHYAVVSSSKDAYDIVQFLLNEQNNNELSSLTTSSSTTSTCLSVKDNDGRIPLHYAAASISAGASGILELLIRHYPDGLMVPDNDGRLPWHYAECTRQDIVYDSTLEYFPTTLETNLDLIPDEIRWDIIQIVPEND